MMNKGVFRRRLLAIEDAIYLAIHISEQQQRVPSQLNDAIRTMGAKSREILAELPSLGQWHMLESVGRLERLADITRDQCRHCADVNEDLREAVVRAYQQLNRLQHQMH